MKKHTVGVIVIAVLVLTGAACRPPGGPGGFGPPRAPNNVRIIPGDRAVTARFAGVLGATGYRLTCDGPEQFGDTPPNGPGAIFNFFVWRGPAVTVDGRHSPLRLSFDSSVNGATITCGVQALRGELVGPSSSLAAVTPVGPPRVWNAFQTIRQPDHVAVAVSVTLEGGDRSALRCRVNGPGAITMAGPGSCSFDVSGLRPDSDYTATLFLTNEFGTRAEPITFSTAPPAG